MAETTVPTSGVEGYTPTTFASSGQTAVVTGDTLVIAAKTKSETKDIVPITDLVTYNLGQLGQPALQLAGDLKDTYVGGLEITGSARNETLTFGADTDVNGKKVKTEVKDTTIDLAGGGSDNLVITGKTNVKKTEVVIDSTDTITNKKGKVFTADDINKNGKLKGAGLGGITFEVNG